MQESGFIDAIIIGEGEVTATELLDAISSNSSIQNVNGIVYKLDGKIVKTPSRERIKNLDELPMPKRQLLLETESKIAYIESSRGCLCSCSFCSLTEFWKTNKKCCLSEKSIERIIEEISSVINTYQINRFSFVDATFEHSIINKSDKKIHSLIASLKNNKLKINFYVTSRVEIIKFVPHETIVNLIDNGLRGIFLGVESFYQNDLLLFNKRTTVYDNIMAIEFFKKFPIKLSIGLINFHPFSTIEQLKTNAFFCHKYNCAHNFCLIDSLMLFQGTSIYDLCLSKNLIVSENYDKCAYMFVNSSVQLLYDAIEQFFDKNDLYQKAEKIKYHFAEFQDILFEIICDISVDADSKDFVCEHYDFLTKKCNELNDFNYYWFNSLLELFNDDTPKKSHLLDFINDLDLISFYEKLHAELEEKKFSFLFRMRKFNKKLFERIV